MKPVIGVMPLWDDDKESIWMLPGYLDGIRAAGGIPVVFPLTDDKDEILRLMDMVQGVLFTGGQDVSPKLYGADKIDESVVCCKMRDRMERIVLDASIQQNKAVLGICRGIQFINAALGGTLYQDLNKQHPSETNHHQNAPYNVPVHKVSLIKDTPLYDLLGRETLEVNSYHHQAVRDLSPKLSVMAVSEDDLIEAVYKPGGNFFMAVQWHPEFAYKDDAASMKIFEAFVKACQNG